MAWSRIENDEKLSPELGVAEAAGTPRSLLAWFQRPSSRAAVPASAEGLNQ